MSTKNISPSGQQVVGNALVNEGKSS